MSLFNWKSKRVRELEALVEKLHEKLQAQTNNLTHSQNRHMATLSDLHKTKSDLEHAIAIRDKEIAALKRDQEEFADSMDREVKKLSEIHNKILEENFSLKSGLENERSLKTDYRDQIQRMTIERENLMDQIREWKTRSEFLRDVIHKTRRDLNDRWDQAESKVWKSMRMDGTIPPAARMVISDMLEELENVTDMEGSCQCPSGNPPCGYCVDGHTFRKNLVQEASKLLKTPSLHSNENTPD